MCPASGTEKAPTESVTSARRRRLLWLAGGSVLLMIGLGIWWVLLTQRWAFAEALQQWLISKSLAGAAFAVGGFAILGVLVIATLWKVPQWQVAHAQDIEPKDRFNSENEARRTLATILGGFILLFGIFGSFQSLQLTRYAQESSRLAREGQIAERFAKAIEQLGAVEATGAKKMVVRVGGIYALERIADESERDHWPIMEVLCTYVRTVAPIKRQQSTREKQASSQRPNSSVDEHPEADVQAILTVLGRRDSKYERLGQYLNLSDTNVTGAYLSGAHLRRATLSGANLGRADLSGADLSGAYLSDADLSGASLVGATLSGAYFGGAYFRGADLSGAYLSGAYLSGAYLGGAHFFKANLRGAYLSEAKNLTQQQIDEATGDATTTLPTNLHVPESWRK